MATFSEWLVFEEIREGVYGESLRRLHIREALRRTFKFYNMAVAGRWHLVLETALEDDDDSPGPDYDPFADGDEDAKPVEVTPEEDEEETKDVPSPAKRKPRKPESKILEAKTIQRYAQIVRWAAMLDRRDAVEKVRQIYRDEVAPLLRQNEGIHRESVDDDDDWGDSYFIDAKPTSQAAPAQNVQPTPKPAPPSGPKRLSVVSKLGPILDKLGYLEKGELEYGTEDEKFEKVARAAAAASNERGNDPPKDHPDVQMLINNPDSRAEYAKFMMSEIGEILKGTAKRVYRQIRRLQGSEGGDKKYGAEMDEDEILNKGVELNISKLQRRIVKKDGVAKDWNNDLSILTMSVDDEEDASRLISTIKSPISTPDRALRDDRRAARMASGQRPGSGGIFTCSDCGHTRSVASRHIGTKMKCPKCQGEGFVQQSAASVSHDAGATAEDGTVTSMDVADTRTMTAPDAASAEETSKEMMDAFREAMKELGQSDPSKATLVCLWLGLHGGSPSDCATAGRLPSDNDIKAVISYLSSANLSDRKAAKDAFDKIGVNNLLPGAKHGQVMEARWNLIRLIKQHNIPAVGVFQGMPPGEIPAGWTPKYTERNTFTPEQDRWYRWMNSVLDNLSKNCLAFLARRMQEIMAERQADIRPKGWESPCSWSLQRFLRSTFATSIRSGSITLKGENPTTITIYGVSKGKKTLRDYSITTDGRQIRIALTMNGQEIEVRSHTHPQADRLCSKCNGASRGCSECEGCGRVIDRIETLKMERRINEFLVAQIGTRAARRKPKA